MLVNLLVGVILGVLGLASAARAELSGPLVEWKFDEGQGDVASDSTGKGHTAKVSGAGWSQLSSGYAISMDGIDDYLDCGESAALGISGPVSVELWIKPTRKAQGMSTILGEGTQTYLLSYYNTEVCDWYIGDGSNSVRGKLTLGDWNHVVACFDGTQLKMWINGRLTSEKESKFKSYKPAGHCNIGSRGGADVPRFKGLIDSVRIYDRDLTAEEVVAHFKSEAPAYGFEPAWFKRLKATPYYYFDRGSIVIEADYKGLQPLQGTGRLEATLIRQDKPTEPIARKNIDALPASGCVEIELPCNGIADGDYAIDVILRDDAGPRPTERFSFSYPVKSAVIPNPETAAVAPLPMPPGPTPFQVVVGKDGGFTVKMRDVEYPFRSRVSWPNGEFNVLAPEGQASSKNEPDWKVDVDSAKDKHVIKASGKYYAIERELRVFPTHVAVKDTYTNTTDQDLGLLIYNEMLCKPGEINGSWLSGHEKRGRRADLPYPDYAPSVFLTDAKNGIAIVPVDDVYIVQSVTYAEDETAGIATEKFALAAGKSYALEWAVYPIGTRDYYDFVNTFRKVEGRISTVDAAFGFISFGPMNRRQVPDEDFFVKRGIKYGVISSMGRAEDDPELSIEGIEFMDFPKEMELLRRQASAFHHKLPGRKVMFHIAHSLYMTNKPDLFADSKVILANGKQAEWGANEPYVSKRRVEQGWTWRIYYPTPGNSFHDALMKSVDVMMDDLGMDGAFMDGFFAAYQGMWTYDGTWDGHSADIDPKTKTITRKVGSVLLLSQPSMIEFARKIRDKGGTVIANSAVLTRSIANEKYIFFDEECASGPEFHLAPNLSALMRPPVGNETELYQDMLDKLSWGQLFNYFIERINLQGPSLAARQFPMTFEDLRAGVVRGPQRIVTMNSGIYGWPNKRDLHLVYKFDARGAPASHDFVTTVDQSSVRTELKLAPNESAVIEPIPVQIESQQSGINLVVRGYDGTNFRMTLNGHGDALLSAFVGTAYPDKRDGVLTDGGINPGVVGVGTPMRVTIGSDSRIIEERDGTLSIPLKLNGQTELVVERVRS